MRYSSFPAETDGHYCTLENAFASIDYRDFVRPRIKPFFMLRARPDVSHSFTTWIGIIRPQIRKAAHLWSSWKQTGEPFSMNPLQVPWDMEGGGEWMCFFFLYTLTINDKRVVICPLSLTAWWVISRRAEKWKERHGRCCFSFPYRYNGMSLWHHTHNHQYSWAAGEFMQVILPQIKNQKKELNKKKVKEKKIQKKKREVCLFLPQLSPRQFILHSSLLAHGSQAWVVHGHRAVCCSNKPMHHLRCLWPLLCPI